MARLSVLVWATMLTMGTPVAMLTFVAPVVAQTANAAASVKAGVEKWRANDWTGAVALWQPFAAAGDADALFNMGQAYKLGRGVTKDPAVARDYYRKAAIKGHLPAQANLGILLFQAGEKPESMRWLKAAADKGEMRAQYVFGIASLNGDGTPRNMGLAYGYLLRAAAQGLTQATSAIGSIEATLSPTDRANGEAVSASLAAGQGVPAGLASRPVLTAQADPPKPQPVATINALPVGAPPVAPKAALPTAVPAKPVVLPAVPAAVTQVVVKPATAPLPAPAAKPAASQALPVPAAIPPERVVTGAPATVAIKPPLTETHAQPQVVVIRPEAPPTAAPMVEPALVAVTKGVPIAKPVAPVAKPVRDAPAKSARKAEPAWRVQLGAFGKRAQAEAAWKSFAKAHRDAARGETPVYESDSGVTKLQLGPFKTRDDAKAACAKLAFAGQSCFVAGN